MKNKLLFIAMAIITIALFAACDQPSEKINVASVTLNKTSLTMTVGDEETLIATIAPNNASNQNVEWSSNAPSVVEVSNGKVTAKSTGSGTITVKTQDGGKTAVCAVTVTSGTPDLSGNITINPSTGVNINTELTANYSGSEAVSYQWKKGGTDVGTNSNKYTPTTAGSYTVTVSAEGYNSKTSAVVDVNDPSLLTLSGTITISPNSGVSVNTELTATYSGNENVSYQWEKDGGSVGTNSNKFTPTTAGNYTVTVSASGYNNKTSNAVTVTGGGGTPTPGAPVITTTTLSVGTEGLWYHQELTATGNTPITWNKESGTLPDGVELNNSGVIYGTPTELGTFTFTVKATNSAGSVTKSLTIVIDSPIFTSINALNAYLSNKPANTAATAYNIKLNVSDLGGNPWEYGSLGYVLNENNTKYVNIDLSGSTFTTIGSQSFSYSCTNLISIIIPNTVTSIGEDAFRSCASLTSVTFEATSKVATIGDNAFNGCSGITSIIIPNSVTSIGNQAFSGCTGFTSVSIPNSVTSIGGGAFRDCTSLTNLIIPNSVTNIIDDFAFYGCTNLEITWIYNPTITISRIRDYLKTVIIPNSVTSIGEDAFRSCRSLTSITIPNTVTSIGNNAFNYCENLTSVTFEGIITSSNFNTWAFLGDLRSKYIAGTGGIGTYTTIAPVSSSSVWTKGNTYLDFIYTQTTDGITTIVKYIGSGGSVTIPSQINNKPVTNIGVDAFRNCTNITSVTIPNGVTSIGNYAFYGCSGLTSINIPNSITSIGNYVFSGCTSLASINIPNSVTSIGSYAFSGCTILASINIPNNVTSIGSYAFSNCTGITSIIIPNSVTSIGIGALNGCSNLNSLTIPFVGDGGNSNTNFNYIFGVAASDVVYPDRDDVKNKVPNPINVIITGGSFIGRFSSTGINNYDAFYSCYGLTSITIPNTVTRIGESAFNWCYRLTSITIPNSVTSIGNFAFYQCTGLTNLTFEAGSKLTSIGSRAFDACNKLTSITIPNSVTSISSSAFQYCNSLTSIRFERANTSFYYTTSSNFSFISQANSESLMTAYTAGGIGTYTRPDTSSTTWTKVSD